MSTGGGGLSRRVERLARPAKAAAHVRGERGETYREFAQKDIRDCPDLLRIEPCDTDPVTYASVRSKIAFALGNDRERAYWEAQVPRAYARHTSLKDMMTAMDEFLRDQEQRRTLALEAARKRLAAGKTSAGGPEMAP